MGRIKNFYHEELERRHFKEEYGWSGYPDPADPDNFWIDDDTGERVNAYTGERTSPKA